MAAAAAGTGEGGGEEMINLLSCPFCGHDGPVLEVHNPDYGRTGAKGREDAARGWNMRVS